MYPRQSPTTHTEQLGGEASVYDWARGQVQALDPTAARVWRQCDGATGRDAIAAALARDLIPEADAVVDLTLRDLARLQLLDESVESRADRPATTRRWLLGRGVAAAMLPANYSIAAPSPVEAQSPGPGTPTLASLSPNQGIQGITVAVILTGTNFVAGATTVNVSGSGLTVSDVVVGSSTSLTANLVLDPAAATGARTVTVTTAAGTSGAQTFTVSLPTPGAPTLTNIAPNEAVQGTTVAVALTGTNFVIGATTVVIAGGGVTVTGVTVSSTTALTASLVLEAGAAVGPRLVTVTTADGTSGPATFTIKPPVPAAPTLTSVAPNQGTQGATVAVTLTGMNFVSGGTTVNVSGTGLTVTGVAVVSSTSLTASFVLDAAAAVGPRNVTVTTAGGTSSAQSFTVNPPAPGAPTLANVSPSQGLRGATVAVTLTGTNFVVGATTVAVAGGGVTVTNVIVGSTTSLTASFMLDLAANGLRNVTVTTPGGTSGAQTFTITLPPPGSMAFNYTGSPQTFTVPPGVVSITILATGASRAASGGPGGLGGRMTATVSVTPGASLTVRVGGQGIGTTGGFNGGANGGTGFGGGGGGASNVRNGATSLAVAGGGGGGGSGLGGGATLGGGNGGAGGGLSADPGQTMGGGGGGEGTQAAGGAGGARSSPTGTDGTAGMADMGGIGGSDQSGVIGGGSGGGGYFGGGGGGGGNLSTAGGGGGGGGSSFTAPGATGVVHDKGVKGGNGSVTISW